MAHPVRGGLTFTPTLEEFAKERAGSPVTVLSGGNNSGKSLVLKWLNTQWEVQSALAAFLQDPVERPKYCPHLKQVLLATLSPLSPSE